MRQQRIDGLLAKRCLKVKRLQTQVAGKSERVQDIDIWLSKPTYVLQTDLQKLWALIQEEIKTSSYTRRNLPPEILLSIINWQVCELKVLF